MLKGKRAFVVVLQHINVCKCMYTFYNTSFISEIFKLGYRDQQGSWVSSQRSPAKGGIEYLNFDHIFWKSIQAKKQGWPF